MSQGSVTENNWRDDSGWEIMKSSCFFKETVTVPGGINEMGKGNEKDEIWRKLQECWKEVPRG